MICEKCHRVKLRCEEYHTVLIDVGTMTALENSQPSGEHCCRKK